MLPRVSVVMPVYNQKPSYLAKAIQSILDQTFDDFEFLIVDDCSTDKDCVSVLEKYRAFDARIRIIRNEVNSGVAKSLNVGIAHASALIIARMDSDDFSLPERLRHQYDFLQNNPTTDLIGCWANIIDEQDHITGLYKTPVSSQKIRSNILLTNPLIHPTWMFRKALIDTFGGYSESSPATEDYEFLLRVAPNRNLENLPEVLFHYRFNPNGVSYKKNKFQELQSIKLRWKALTEWNYPLWEIYKALPSVFMYIFIPFALKAEILKRKQKHL